MYYNIHPIKLRKYECPTYHMSLLRQHLNSSVLGHMGVLCLRKPFIWGTILCHRPRVSNNSKGSNSLDCPGFILQWEHVPCQPWGPPSLLYSEYLISFPGVKQPGHGVDHPHLSSTMVKMSRAIHLPP